MAEKLAKATKRIFTRQCAVEGPVVVKTASASASSTDEVSQASSVGQGKDFQICCKTIANK
jgi:hypothetical protein